MIRKGEPWAVPAAGPPDEVVEGGDPDLAAAARRRPGSLFAYRPLDASDLALALGVPGAAGEPLEAPLDVLEVSGGGAAVNAVVVGWGPHRARWWHRAVATEVTLDGRVVFEGRATGVVVANGPFLGGRDVVPGAHPGDGRMEVQVCAVPRRERAEMRRRTANGSHVPHPGITLRRGRLAVVRLGRPVPVEVDGVPRGRLDAVEVALDPSALRLHLGGIASRA